MVLILVLTDAGNELQGRVLLYLLLVIIIIDAVNGLQGRELYSVMHEPEPPNQKFVLW